MAEQAAVFAIELAGGFITDFKGGGGGIAALVEHEGTGGLETKLLLVLDGAHGGEGAEVVVEGGDTHAGDLGELLDAERFVVIVAEPVDGFGGALALVALRGDGAEASAFRAVEDAVDDLALDERAEEGNVLWGVEQLEEPAEGIE